MYIVYKVLKYRIIDTSTVVKPANSLSRLPVKKCVQMCYIQKGMTNNPPLGIGRHFMCIVDFEFKPRLGTTLLV